LRVAVIYGANGAGKSNLFKALSYVERMALTARPKGSGTGREAFQLGLCGQGTSNFDLQFIAGSSLYRFGFKADDNQIREEWLARVEGEKETILYERVTNDLGEVQVEVPGLKDAKKLLPLAQVGGPQNQTFLATIHVTLEMEDLDQELREVLTWFRTSLNMITPDSSTGPVGTLIANSNQFKQFADDFLKAASTGVDHLKVVKKEISEDELSRLLPKSIVSRILKEIAEDPEGTVIQLGEDSELLIEPAAVNRFYTITLQSIHLHQQGQEVALQLLDESDGTRRLLSLAPALYHPAGKGDDSVYFIDEIDRSMHPKLVYDFLKLFIELCTGTQRQLIVTTHESNLLDQDLLRRDEIWFAEKDSTSATRLYSLSEFKLRSDLEIRKHYLQGRFGAIPFLGNLERLQKDREAAE